MLDKFRGFADTLAAKILMGLIALSFLSWGITGYLFNGGGNPVVAKFGNTDIKLAVFNNEYHRQVLQIEQMVGNGFRIPDDMKESLVYQILDNMQYRILMDQNAENLGFVMTTDAIFEVIQQQDEFKDEKGVFSYDKYYAIMSYNNISEKNFHSEISKQNGRFLIGSLLKSSVAIPALYVDFIYDFNNQSREIKYISVDFNSVKVPPVSTETLNVTYEQNKQMFVTPEYKKIEYIQILPEHVKGKFSAEALLKKAEEVENEVVGGMGFTEIAKNQSVEYGKLPFLTVGMYDEAGKEYSDKVINKDLMKVVYEISEGQETQLIAHKNGYIIMFVSSVKPAAFLPLEKVKDKIEKIALENEKNKLAYVEANEMLKNAKEGNLKAASSMNIKRTDKNVDEQLLSKVFSGKEGDWIVAKNKNSYMVAQIGKTKTGAKDNAELQKVANLLKEQLPDLVMQDYMNYLKKTYGSKVYINRILDSIN